MIRRITHVARLACVLFFFGVAASSCAPLTAERAVTPPAEVTTAASVQVVEEQKVEGSAQATDALSDDPIADLLPTPTLAPLPTSTVGASNLGERESTTLQTEPFAVGNELTIDALRKREITGSDIVIEQALADGANYARYIASYQADGNKIYGLLTVPRGDIPDGGFPAIVFNHGYIPPAVYRTTERYEAYVDALARSGFVVFKIDMRGFGESEGEATGAYFSPDYTIDAISALKSLQRLDYVNAGRIGMWGHSMAGNLLLRAMLVEPSIKAGVIWAGAVYSYDDMVQYAIDDPSFRRDEQPDIVRRGTVLREEYGPPNTEVPFWKAVSLTENIEFLRAPLQIHHAVNDEVVNIGYSRDLADMLEKAGKVHEFHQYDGGGHNISSPYFSEAMQRTIEFFRTHL